MVVHILRYRLAVVLCLVSFYSQAQCAKRAELLALFDASFTQPYPTQVATISSVLSDWNRCQYPKDSLYVNIALDYAKLRFDHGDAEGAINQIKQVLPLYDQKQPGLKAEDQLKAYYRLGFYWKGINDYKRAQEAAEKAVRLGERLPGSRWTSFACTTLAYIYSSNGEYQKAVESAELGMYQAKRANDAIAYLETWGEKIKALLALGNQNQANRELQSAIATARKMPNASYYLAIFLVRLAKLRKINSDFSQALTCYQEALTVNTANDSKKDIVDNLTDLGLLFYELKQNRESIKYYRRALYLTNDPYVRLHILGNMGAVYWRQRQYTAALAYYQAGLTVAPMGFTKRLITDSPNPELIRNVTQKEFLLTLIQDKADTWLDYAKATNNHQRFQYALDTYKVADKMIDFMRWEHTGQQSKLYWRQKTRGMYERAIETCYRLNNTEQALRFFEKSRAAMLADKLNELGARQQLAPQQVEKEHQLQQEVSSQQAKLADAAYGTTAYDTTLVEMGKRQRKLDDFLKQIETTNPAYYRYKYDTTTRSLADLHSHLAKQTASYVTYFVGDSALYVLGVMANRDTLLRQPVRGYQQNVQAFMSLLANSDAMNRKVNRDHFLALGNGLYTKLLAPLNLPAGSVIVSPDGSFVPFEALSRKADTPDYLVKDYAFSYTYSARLLLKRMGKVAKNSRLDFLGIAPVDFAPSLKQVMLPGSEEALIPIANRFNSRKLLTHKDATRRDFLTQATNARVIHLFTHATADSTDREPMLYFADSTLRLSDLSDGALPNAELVVLAACKTGIGANQRGEGVFSLARGFAALGVPSVLTTLWSVEDDATYKLTDLFYKYLDEGLSKDIALQRAKKEWLSIPEGANQLPNYWAGLIVVGDTKPLPQLNLVLWGSILLVLLVAAGLIVWHERRKRRVKAPVSLSQPA